MLLRRWTAPTRPLCHPEKEQCHRRGRSYPTAQSTACSELLTVSGKDKPEKNASCCDPDKGSTERQGDRSQKRPNRDQPKRRGPFARRRSPCRLRPRQQHNVSPSRIAHRLQQKC